LLKILNMFLVQLNTPSSIKNNTINQTIKCKHNSRTFPPSRVISQSLSFLSSGLTKNVRALLESNIIVFVRQKLGTILKTHYRMSPAAHVDSISLNTKTMMAPIPPKTKCRKIVMV